jgi:hypothetical protein
MEDKKILLNEIKELWNTKNIDNFDISPELLDYLELNDLKKLKAKILESKNKLSKDQKEWLSKFRKNS